MLVHPQFNPIALDLGFVSVHWYGLMYLLAFGLFWFLGGPRCKQPHIAAQGWERKDIEDLLFYGVLGVIIGGRLGYMVFYKADYYFGGLFSDDVPESVSLGQYYLGRIWRIVNLKEGGMSFHGGFLGVLFVSAVYARVKNRNWWDIMDLVAPCIPLGIAAGRLGNFINGELWGRAAESWVPWAMVFPQSGTMFARHPSQLYELFLEGIVLFVVLWMYAAKPRARGCVSTLFLGGYGLARFFVEFFREPDSFLGLQALDLSRGQWLCVPMIAGAIVLYVAAGHFAKNARAQNKL